MNKTIYIEPSEEIIGIISKIRNSGADDIFLVVPKNSQLTQGIINLKLLKKEVEKMGKNITLVTSDQHSRDIIKKVKLNLKHRSPQDFSPNQTQEAYKFSGDESLQLKSANRKREIGTSTFYAEPKQPPKTDYQETKKEIAGSSFEFPFKKKDSKKIPVKTFNSFGEEHIRNRERREIPDTSTPITSEKENFEIKEIWEKQENPQEDALSKFYRNKEAASKNIASSEKDKAQFLLISKRKKVVLFLSILFLTTVVSFGFWIFQNWPKMKVDLSLAKHEIKTELELEVCAENKKVDCLEGRYVEITIEKSKEFSSTGEQFSNTKGMARGLVEITNNYSSSNQPLVERTRILSENGKLFRLVESIIVPGMKNGEPGKIEAKVIADQIGDSFNIEPTTFTIEGLKGSEKYEKFKVVSKAKMIGGANDTENQKVKVVTEQDINKAREETIEFFNQELEKSIKENLKPEEIFSFDSIEKEIIKIDSSYKAGEVIEKFQYTVKEKIKLIAFNEKEFERKITDSIDPEKRKDLNFINVGKISYEKSISNFDEKKIEMSFGTTAFYWPSLDINEVRENLAGKNNSEVKEYLTNLKTIEKAVVLYSPAWLGNVPVKASNIEIKELK